MTAEQREIVTRGMDPATGKRIEQRLPADCYGPLAIHPSWECDGWAVSHADSGYLVCKVPEYDVAVELAQGMAGFDWRIPEPARFVPGPLKVEVTTYLRQMKKKYVEITSTAFDLAPEPPPRRR